MFFSFSLETGLEEEKTDFKPALFHLKNKLVSHPVRGGGVG